MNVKPATIAVAAIVIALQWPMLEYDRADAKLSEFYSQVAAAKFGDARQSIDEAIRLWPSNGRYYGWRAYCTSQSLPPRCPRHSEGANAALSESDRQAVQEAVADYRHALELNSRDAVAHHNLGWLEHLLGNDPSAANNWQEAIAIDPDTAVFHLSYGMFLEESGKADAAKQQYRSAIVLSPSIVDSPLFTQYRSRLPQSASSVISDVTQDLEKKLQGGRDPILEARLGKLYEFKEIGDRRD